MPHSRARGILSAIRHRQFRKAYRTLMLMCTPVYLLACVLLTWQHALMLLSRMSDAADLLAVRTQDELNAAQTVSFYVSSVDSVRTLLMQEQPALEPLLRFDDALTPFASRYASVELFLTSSSRVIVSDFGVGSWSEYPDAAFVERLRAPGPLTEEWLTRTYRKSAYLEAAPVLSFVRSLPMYEPQTLGFAVVNLPVHSLRETVRAHANAVLGEYAVWLGEIPIVSSASLGTDAFIPPSRAYEELGLAVRPSTAATAAKAAYAMPWPRLLRLSMPHPSLIALGYLLLALCMFALALLISRSMLAPIGTLVKRMGVPGAQEETDEALERIATVFDNLTDELAHAQRTVRDNLPLLRERLVGELLRTHTAPAQRAEALKRCGVELPHPYFAVVVLALADGSPPDEALRLVVQKNVQSMLLTLGHAYSTYGEDDSILFLLNAPQYEGLDGRLQQVCATLQAGLLETLSLRASFFIGLCSPAKPVLYDAYRTALEQMRAARVLGEHAGQLSIDSQSEQNPPLDDALAHSLCTAVLDQDRETLDQALSQLRFLCFGPQVPPAHARKLALSCLCRVCAELTEGGLQPSAEAFAAAFKRLSQETEADALFASLSAWCRGLLLSRRSLSDESYRYVRSAVAFIETHYAERLSVPQIAQAISLNPIYLNRLFKCATGKTISDTLNSYRTERAKELMANRGLTVSEAAAAAGFSETRSFIRFFKKYYGETPGEYKKRLQKETPER